MYKVKKAACCFIQREGKILGVSRKDNPRAWGLPGGKVDFGETFEQAARRELKEETGLEAVKLHSVFTHTLSDGYEAMTFAVEVKDFDIQVLESGRVDWITWEELLEGPFGEYNGLLKKQLTV
jgi:8-oxo-dGTP pyrophosphatase MutT (NUDIX family)